MLLYFRGRWPEEEVPPGEPTWLHYEVYPNEDAVLRAVEIFADGRSERSSLALESRDGFPCLSIVHGPFMEHVAEWPVRPMTAEEFERLWECSIDKPFP
jgi:hypothetical protein